MRMQFGALAAFSIALLTGMPEPLRSESAAPGLPDAAAIKIELNGVFAPDPDATPSAPARTEQTVSMGLFAYGLPARYVIRVDGGQVSLMTQEGKALPITPRFGLDPCSPQQVRAVQAALGDVRLFAVETRKFDIVPLFSRRTDTLAKHWSDFLRFSATLEFQLAEYAVVGRLPLKAGARPVSGTLPGRIVSMERNGEDFAVHIDEGSRGKTTAGETVYVVQNSRSKEALLGSEAIVISVPPRPKSPQIWHFSDADTPSGSLLTREWLAEAELVCLELRKVATFARSFSRDPLQLSFDIPGQRGRKSDYSETTLKEIVLPPSASKEQMREYVREIVAVSRKQKISGYEDPQVAMFMKLGPKNLDVLIDEAPVPRTNKDLHLWKAMREIVRQEFRNEHRDLILSRLEGKPDVADLLLDSEWVKEARPILLKGIATRRNDLPASWIEAVISFREPKTYPALTEYYLRNPGDPGLYSAIRALPGIDLKSLMSGAWATAKDGSIRQQSFAIHPACEWGVVDALATAAEWLQPGATDYQQRVGRRVFAEYTPARGENEELLAWYEAHKTSLVFDADRKMFVARP